MNNNKNINNTTTEHLLGLEPTIGEKLRTARTKKGVSVDKASDFTKIKAFYIDALESDRFEKIPAVVYTKNFIRIYGTYLELDGVALAEEFSRGSSNKSVMPPKSKKARTSTIDIIFGSIFHHKFIFITSILFVAAVIIFFTTSENGNFGKTKNVKKTDNNQVVAKVEETEIDRTEEIKKELNAYRPVVDMKEPLPGT